MASQLITLNPDFAPGTRVGLKMLCITNHPIPFLFDNPVGKTDLEGVITQMWLFDYHGSDSYPKQERASADERQKTWPRTRVQEGFSEKLMLRLRWKVGRARVWRRGFQAKEPHV